MSTIKKPPKTGPSTATTAILVLLVAAVACYTLYQIVGRQHSRYETVAAYTCEVDDETTVSGFVVRQESLLPNQDSGVLDITRDEGERVGVDGNHGFGLGPSVARFHGSVFKRGERGDRSAAAWIERRR